MHGLALAFNCVHYGATLIGKSITLGYIQLYCYMVANKYTSTQTPTVNILVTHVSH